jgi:RNA polymerase sigma-70 factor (ECF subfamily)
MKNTRERISLAQVRAELAALSDAQLVELVQQGERSAYAEIVRRYQRKLLRTIFRMVGSVETAEDLTQDAFLKAYERLDQFDVSKRFGPWLFQIAVNATIDWLRRYRRHQPLSLDRSVDEERTHDVPTADPRESAELSQEVHHVLAQLPDAYRTVLLLRDLEGFSCSEVAAIVGRREPTVRWRLAKAREMFRDIWNQRQKTRSA